MAWSPELWLGVPSCLILAMAWSSELFDFRHGLEFRALCFSSWLGVPSSLIFAMAWSSVLFYLNFAMAWSSELLEFRKGLEFRAI